MLNDNQLSIELASHWEGLQVDTSGDEFTAGGQSVKELQRLEAFEAFLGTLPGETIRTVHEFSDGLYMRTIYAPKDAVIIGHEHLHECLNIMQAGRVLTIVNGQVVEFTAPFRVKSGARTRKASVVVEDMIWTTVHPNPDNEQDISKLEERLLVKSQAFLLYEQRNDNQEKV